MRRRGWERVGKHLADRRLSYPGVRGLLSEAIMFGACQQLLVTNRRINRGQTTRASARGRFEVVLFGMLDRARISSTTTALASA
jgi:hypothetical protein